MKQNPVKSLSSILDISSEELAQLLTKSDFSKFKNIPDSEFLELAQKQTSISVSNPPQEFIKFTERYTNFTRWTMSLILLSSNLIEAMKIINKLADIAETLKSLHNYSSFVAILNCLTHENIVRFCDPKLSKVNICFSIQSLF